MVSDIAATRQPPPWDWKWIDLPTDTPADKQKSAEMLRAAQDFIADIREGQTPRWLVLLGSPGCGKTHIAIRIRDWLRKYGRWCYDKHVYSTLVHQAERSFSYVQEASEMTKWGDLIESAREKDRWHFHRACRDHYKIIDDLGVDSFTRDTTGHITPTPFAVQKMGEILDRRLNKWTVITANFSISTFSESFDSRIASRLIRNSVVVNAMGMRDFKLEEYRSKTR